MDFTDGSTWFLCGVGLTVAVTTVLVVAAWIARSVRDGNETRSLRPGR